jgi:hypothetical protein
MLVAAALVTVAVLTDSRSGPGVADTVEVTPSKMFDAPYASVADSDVLGIRDYEGAPEVWGLSGPAAMQPCPIRLPEPCGTPLYQKGACTESWKAVSSSGCAGSARAMLNELRDNGATLIESGYLDLFGRQWGCVAQTAAGEVLTVTVASVPAGKAAEAAAALLPGLPPQPADMAVVTVVRARAETVPQ